MLVIWKVAEAKHSLSRLLEEAQREPQLIHRRDELIGVVLGAEQARAYLEWLDAHRSPSLRDLVAEIGRACADEDFALPVSERSDRDNPLLDTMEGGRRGPKQQSTRPPKRDRKARPRD